MTHQPLYLAIIWHMHQPYYKDLVKKEYFLPWVRLHGIKDYYDMVALLDDYPNMKATFNLVPSLVMQINDYAQNDAKDLSLVISEKDPKYLFEEEIIYLLKNFFMANWETMIKPYNRYHSLLLKRGRFASHADLLRVAKHFTRQELLDIQVWFNLSWFGFHYKKNDPLVSSLIEKGAGFTIQEKLDILKKQKELLSRIIPKHKELLLRGQIEVTTSPFYHPILPLLCDTNIAKESMPYIKLPLIRFRHPEDAERQISEAVKFHEAHFGEKPSGMWPSEGSVSEEIVPLVAKNGIKWIATDESILASSLMKSLSASELYKPYKVNVSGNEISVVFRNHLLSDQIGFVYQRWRAKDAVADFKKHLYNIKSALPNDGKRYLVSVILDGENAWEYFKDGGEEFLRTLYHELSSDPNIVPVRVKDFIEENPVDSYIPRLFPASWINNNFRIWIGHEEDNVAWDYLSRARTALENSDNNLAWQELYIAEGSDWCWWYGDDHSSDNDDSFDALFRKHLANIYQLLGKAVPKHLDTPIKQLRTQRPTKEPVYFIEPTLDGLITNYYEWLSAGCFDVEHAKGAMHQTDTLVKSFYYGFNKTNLFFRIDCQLDLKSNEAKEFSFAVVFHSPSGIKLQLYWDKETGDPRLAILKMDANESWEKVKDLWHFGINRTIEFGMSFEDLSVKSGDEIYFSVVVEKSGNELENWPRGGSLVFSVPTSSFEMEQWSI